MNKKLLDYIDCYLNHSATEPVEQLVYITAKLSLISTPVAWMVKSTGMAEDMLFTNPDDARKYIETIGRSVNYISPLYSTMKVDLGTSDILRFILANSPPKEE